MREIKFRAWDIELKRYIHEFNYNGYEINDNNGAIYITKHLDTSGETPLLEIEQFTGLHDKNGKEIYEGDIVKYDTPPENGLAAISSYIGNNLYFCWHNSPVPPTNADIFGCKDELEVIGNIHENPELLEGRE